MPDSQLTPEARAYKRGQESTLLAQHMADDARSFGEIKAQLGEGSREMRGLREGLGSLKEEFVKFRTEAETRAEAAKEHAEGALQAKQFYVGLVVAVTAVAALLAGTGHI